MAPPPPPMYYSHSQETQSSGSKITSEIGLLALTVVGIVVLGSIIRILLMRHGYPVGLRRMMIRLAGKHVQRCQRTSCSHRVWHAHRITELQGIFVRGVEVPLPAYIAVGRKPPEYELLESRHDRPPAYSATQ